MRRGSATFNYTSDDVTGAMNGSAVYNAYCEVSVIVSGTIQFTGSQDSDSNTALVYSLTMTFNSLVVSDGTNSQTYSGSIGLTFSSPGGVSLVISTDFQGSNGTVYRVTNFTFDATPTTGGDNITMSGDFCHPTHGCVTVSTPTVLFVPTRATYPTSGVLHLAGSNSTAHITVQANSTFMLEVDANGDGAYDSTSTVSWTGA